MSEEKKPTKYYSNKQEKILASELGWAKIGGSGAAPCAPGDIRASEWLGECKTHTKESAILFDLGVWNKIKEEAYSRMKKPVLFVDDGSQKPDNTWCVCLAKNINASSLMLTDLPMAVKKNITFKDKEAKSALKEVADIYVGEFYTGVAFEYEWNGETVLVMTFETFKGIYKK